METITFRRIAIMGAGGMGTLLGAHLNRQGVAAELIDVNRAHVQALREHGATVVGMEEFCVPVTALTPDEIEGEYDLVFFMVKQPYNASALASLRGHVAEDGIVCTLQNGLPEPAVAEVFGDERTMGCAVTWTAALAAPGVTRAGSEKSNWHCTLGRPDGAVTDKVRAVQAVLSLVNPTEITTQLTGVRWSKLLVNCTFSGVSAALGCSFGDILAEPRALRCAQFVARELLHVTAALGVTLPPLGHGEDFRELMDFSTEEERKLTDAIYHRLWGPSGSAEASMLQDLRRGTACEIDYINGVLSEAGKKAGVPTPVCDEIIRIVRRAEQTKTVPTMAELEALSAKAVL